MWFEIPMTEKLQRDKTSSYSNEFQRNRHISRGISLVEQILLEYRNQGKGIHWQPYSLELYAFLVYDSNPWHLRTFFTKIA